MKLKNSYLLLFVISVIFFFGSFFFRGSIPVPSDTIVGLYHPFRDLYAKEYPRGVPFKNFAITDPVRQQYLWKELTISLEKNLSLPLWNPYNFAGTPLLANFQSGAFYPLNLIFLLSPFYLSWSIFIILQPLLAGIFLFFYLRNLNLGQRASLLGSITFAFSGFAVSWLEWGNVIHTGLWLPLILLSIDKIIYVKDKKIWSLVLLLSLALSFFAGHLQIFFYTFLLSSAYLLARVIKQKRSIKSLLNFIYVFIAFVVLTLIQWIPTLQFISLSGRNIDQDWRIAGWFIPWENLVQFISPDFFGNPATLNYWGTWNYGEFIGYVGIFSLIMALYAIIIKKDKRVIFFAGVLFIALILALPTIFAKIPYKFSFPLISTSQPTRLIFIIDFALSVLAAYGFEYFLKSQSKKLMSLILVVFAAALGGLWYFVIFNPINIPLENIAVSKNNLILPSLLFLLSSFLIATFILFSRHLKALTIFIPIILILVLFLDLFRFGNKYLTFSKAEYLFPQTNVINFLQSDKEQFRIMATDSRIFPPNFSSIYRIQSIDGYDPLYLLRYGEFSAALGRGQPNIDSPFGFNRIITPQNFRSPLVDLLNVKYILSFNNIEKHPKIKKVFQDGETSVYLNENYLPRAFFVKYTYLAKDKQDAINALHSEYPLSDRAVVENIPDVAVFNKEWATGSAEIKTYEENKVIIETSTPGEGFLVLSDNFYPIWKVKIDNVESEIYLTNYSFRGVIVPGGKHRVEFYATFFK